MKLGWLVTAGKIVVKGSSVVQAVVAASHATEAVVAATGQAKEDEAVKLLQPILAAAGLSAKNTPAVQDATRRAMQAYVAAQNARVAAEEALEAFEDAKQSLEFAVASVR